MASVWDSVVAGASKAATQAGEATQVVATKAKLHADILVIDRDIHARKEKFGVDMYAHLEKITSTQEFYVADDRLINVIRPTLIKAQREVAAYERKRDTMRGKVNMAEANRSGSASIFAAQTIGEKLMNAAKYAAAGAKEAASKTELAMLERQILGFKEEFGVELYPVFESMEDNEGWLPTDRKVRSLYDSAREDIAAMVKLQNDKREQIKQLDGVEGTGLTPPTVAPSMTPPTVVANPIDSGVGGQQTTAMRGWSSTGPTTTQPVVSSNGYGSSQQPPPQVPVTSFGGAMDQYNAQQQQPSTTDSGFGFMQPTTQPQYIQQQPKPAVTQQQPQQQSSLGAVFDPFDAISNTAPTTYNSTTAAQPVNNTASQFDQFSLGNTNTNQSRTAFSDADMNLFKY